MYRDAMPPKNFSVLLVSQVEVTQMFTIAAVSAVSDVWINANPTSKPTKGEAMLLAALALLVDDSGASFASIGDAILTDQTLLTALATERSDALAQAMLSSFASVAIVTADGYRLIPEAKDLATYLNAAMAAFEKMKPTSDQLDTARSVTVTFVASPPATSAQTGTRGAAGAGAGSQTVATTAEAKMSSVSTGAWIAGGLAGAAAVLLGTVFYLRSRKGD